MQRRELSAAARAYILTNERKEHKLKGGSLKHRSDRPSSQKLKSEKVHDSPQIDSIDTAMRPRSGTDSKRSGTPDRQPDTQSHGQVSVAQTSKSASRSLDIVGSAQDFQTGLSDAIFSQPRRQNTNSSHKEVTTDRERGSEKHSHTSTMSLEALTKYQDAELQRLNTQLRESQEATQLAQGQVDSLNNELRRQRQEANAQIASMEAQHRQTREENEAKIRRLVDGATRDKVEGKWNPAPDADIRSRLTALNVDMREWAKVWATKTLVVDKSVSEETVKYFSDFMRFDKDRNFPLLVRKPPPKLKEKIAGLLLHAALSHQVHDAFFDGTAFCLKPRDRAVVDALFDEMVKVDAKNAHIWRAGLWRLLNPPVVDRSRRLPAMLETTYANVREYCEKVSVDFCKSAANILFAVVAENGAEAQSRAAKLRVILQQASVIATSFWTQHSWFAPTDLTMMKMNRMVYDNAVEWLEPHPWSNVDEDSDSANGREILLVARPGLLAFDADDTDGVAGDRYRILAKALVLLDGKY